MTGSHPVSVFTLASLSRVPSLVSDAVTNLRLTSAAKSFGIDERSFISMVANGLSIVNIYLYALAVGADVHIAEAAVVTPVVLAVGLLPISINGIGTIELTFVFLLGLMGVDPQVALAVAILRRLVLLGQSLVGGVLYTAGRFG